MIEFITGLIIGIFAGAFFGVIITAVAVAASDRDKREDHYDS